MRRRRRGRVPPGGVYATGARRRVVSCGGLSRTPPGELPDLRSPLCPQGTPGEVPPRQSPSGVLRTPHGGAPTRWRELVPQGLTTRPSSGPTMKEIVAGGEPKGQPKLVPPPALGEPPDYYGRQCATNRVPT